MIAKMRTLPVFLLLALGFSGAARNHRFARHYLAACKYDAEIINNDARLASVIENADLVFSGKVSSEVKYDSDNKTMTFNVFVKRFFKNSGALEREKKVKVSKVLQDGEGTKCRQVVRFRYTAIFIGRKPEGNENVDVQLTISPVSITLANLDRVNAATKVAVAYLNPDILQWIDADNHLREEQINYNQKQDAPPMKGKLYLYLYTHSNIDNAEIFELDIYMVQKSLFLQSTWRTVFLVHDWYDNYTGESMQVIKNTLLGFGNINVFVFDYSKSSRNEFRFAKTNTKYVGHEFGDFLENYVTYVGIQWKITLIGYGIGAHIAGIAGSNTPRRIPIIIGLDPLQIGFDFKSREAILDKTDADFVHIIHTSDYFGTNISTGHADYYPNGGTQQPGCTKHLSICSHSTAYKYYVKSITWQQTKFKGRLCKSFAYFKKAKCNKNDMSALGGYVIDKGADGNYYLFTKLSDIRGKSNQHVGDIILLIINLIVILNIVA